MNNKVRLLSILGLSSSLLIIQESFAWHVTVHNDSPLSIKARCKKVGAIKVDWETILPNASGKCDCGGADCPNGVEVQVTIGKKVLNLSTSWQIKCGNVDVRVVPVPTWEITKSTDAFNQSTQYKLTGFKLAIGSEFEIPAQDLIPYSVK
jgi:hypothetical protein